MKKQLLSLVMILLPMFHVGAVVIDGINYHLITKGNVAEVSYTSNLPTTDVVIPQTITYENMDYTVVAIQESAFSNKTNLKSITLPKVLTSIGNYAFFKCTSLKSIVMPDTLKELGEYAFGQCSSIRSVKIPQGVSNIEKETFWQCKQLLEIHFPNSIKRIKEDAFSGCNSLNAVYISDLKTWCDIIIDYGTANPLQYAKRLFINNTEIKDLVIPDDVTSINGYVFSGCENLESVTIPKSLSSFGVGAFNGCTGLKAVYISDLAAWCKIEFGYQNWSSPLCYAKHLYLNGNEIINLEIPYGITSIYNYTFSNCTGFITINLPNSIISIGTEAFWYCISLKSLTIPNSVISIDTEAFYGCRALEEIVIGSGIKKIYSRVFSDCKNITDVYCYADIVPQTYADVFENSYIEYAILHVPETSIDAYKATAPWKNFKEIVALTDDDPKPTEIMTIEAAFNEENNIYNLNGVRLSRPKKGINIVNGKKYVIK